MGELKSLVQAALLQQADVNVTEHYLAASEKSINVYPNPTNAIANIEYYVSEETVTALSITSVDGSIVATAEQVNSKSGWNRIVFDGSQLASGIYHYTIQSNGETQNGQIIISK